MNSNSSLNASPAEDPLPIPASQGEAASNESLPQENATGEPLLAQDTLVENPEPDAQYYYADITNSSEDQIPLEDVLSGDGTQSMDTLRKGPASGRNVTLVPQKARTYPVSWSGTVQTAPLGLRNARGESMRADIRLERAELSLDLPADERKGSGTIDIPVGTYKVTITPSRALAEKGAAPPAQVDSVVLDDAQLSTSYGIDLGLESVPSMQTPFGKEAKRAFAIDPTRINFTTGKVTAIAKGSQLFKCAQWDFESQTCNGDWAFVQELTPGLPYEILLTPDDPAYVEYNSTYGAPRCNNYTSPCIANTSMLQSHDSAAVPEPNQPNTIDACADGASGVYLTDENVENITITDLNGTTFNAGDWVNVTAWVYCYDGTADNINFVYTSSAASPTWVVKNFTDPCPAAGFNQVSTAFPLDNTGGEHAVRVIIQYNGATTTTCGAGQYDDNDDVVLQVNGTIAVNPALPADGIIAYRSTSSNGVNYPKIRFWNASASNGNGSWGSEVELATAGSPVRYALVRMSPISGKLVVVTQSDDGNLDAYVCRSSCGTAGSWTFTGNIGNVWTTAPTVSSRRFNMQFEPINDTLMLVYAVVSTNTSRDLAYKVLPAGNLSFTGVTENYIDDTVLATDQQYAWVAMDEKPRWNNQMVMTSISTAATAVIRSWVWNGTAWGNILSLSTTSSATGSYEAIDTKYTSSGSQAMVLGGSGTTGAVSWAYWNGSAWTGVSSFDVDGTDGNDVRMLNLKAHPTLDYLQAVAIDSGSDLNTVWWNGSAWNVTSNLDTTVDSAAARIADFAWDRTGTSGRVVWDTDTTGTTISQRLCNPNCNTVTSTVSTYAGTGSWTSLWTNPFTYSNVSILGVRMNTAFAFGSFRHNGSLYTNYGDTAIATSSGVSTFESYGFTFNTLDVAPPNVSLVNDTPANNANITTNYTYINATASDNYYVSSAWLEWNGTDYPMTRGSGFVWYINQSIPAPGMYTYRVWANDTTNNRNVTEWRNVTYNNNPNLVVLAPLGGNYTTHRYVSLAVNITSLTPVNLSYATVFFPNGSKANVTLGSAKTSDDFSGAVASTWFKVNNLLGSAQNCTADINTTISGKAYTLIEGNGNPYTRTFCALVSNVSVDSDFDMNISFSVLNESGLDYGLSLALVTTLDPINVNRYIRLYLGNFTAIGRRYMVYVDDGVIAGPIFSRVSSDTQGKLRIKREGSNFSFYTWNATSSSWKLETSANLSLNRALFPAFFSGSSATGWGNLSVSWDDFGISTGNYSFGLVDTRSLTGQYNVTFTATDTLGWTNASVTTNFTVIYGNYPPVQPLIYAPGIGQTIVGTYTLQWLPATDESNDAIRYNITLLNPDYSPNTTIISNYGNSSIGNYSWDSSTVPDGSYSIMVLAYENETAEHLTSSHYLVGTFYINNSPNIPPQISLVYPFGGEFPALRPVPIAVNAYEIDADGINTTWAQVTRPNGSVVNVTLQAPLGSDNFSADTLGATWFIENISTSQSQSCSADINGLHAGKATVSLSGDGTPETDTLCSLVSKRAIFGDFDISIRFNATELGEDAAANFQVMHMNTSASSARMIFFALSNWSGSGLQYEIFADDGNISEYILQRPTDDLFGGFRLNRTGDTFTFYTWNSTASAWNEEQVSQNVFSFAKAVFVAFETESAAPNWGSSEVIWDDFTVASENVTLGLFEDTTTLGVHNFTVHTIDNRGGTNSTTQSNFTIIEGDLPPSKPYLLTPSAGALIGGWYNITWSQVNYLTFNETPVRFNITLLNPDYSFNATIASAYGNINSTTYAWDTTGYPDGTYSLEVLVYDTKDPGYLRNSFILSGNFTVHNAVPSLIPVEPTGGSYPWYYPVPLVANITPLATLNQSIAQVTYPNGTSINKTLFNGRHGDNFDANSMGFGWFKESKKTGPGQTCVADINTTVVGKAYTAISGDGSPITDSYCSLISHNTIYGDFDMNVSFEILAESGEDYAAYLQVQEINSSADTADFADIMISNYAGEGKRYGVWASDGGEQTTVSIPTEDTSGMFRIKRVASNFSFFVWNSTAAQWLLLAELEIPYGPSLYLVLEAESTYPNWGSINVSWDNLSIDENDLQYNILAQMTPPFLPLGVYNVTWYAIDDYGGTNASERSNFTVIAANNAPSTPYLLDPYPGSIVRGTYNITWSQVTDINGDSVQFNITLLNADGSDNLTIIDHYGSTNSSAYAWDSSSVPDGNYSLRIVAFENESIEGKSADYTLLGTFLVRNAIPSIIVIEPLGNNYSYLLPVPLAANMTPVNELNLTIAQVSFPNGSVVNRTLYNGRHGDSFEFDTVGIGWAVENTSIGPSQTCIADINTTIVGKAYTSISGNGAPESDTLCSLVSHNTIYGDFDFNLSFSILQESGSDFAINLQVMEVKSSYEASSLAYMSLTKFSGNDRAYEVYADDTVSGLLASVPTEDTEGMFRIRREGSNFSFYVWNATAADWLLLNKSSLNFSNALYIAFESESAYPGWGSINASWDNFTIDDNSLRYNILPVTLAYPLGTYNVSWYAQDIYGSVNATETSQFTVYASNARPSKPYILDPFPGQAVEGNHTIVWSSVYDPNGDPLQFDITLLNSDGSDNQSIVSEYGNSSSTQYTCDSTLIPDGEYSLRVDVYENETAELLSNSYTHLGTCFINNEYPNVTINAPLGGSYPEQILGSISIKASDVHGIGGAYANVTHPNGTVDSIPFLEGLRNSTFTQALGTEWVVDQTVTGPGQTCTADVNASYPNAGYVSLTGDGTPLTDTYCSLMSVKTIDGDFDLSISFNITSESGTDHALNLQLMEKNRSSLVTRQIFIALSNWTGIGRGYEIFGDDSSFSDYVYSEPSEDTSGRLRIKRVGNNFTFYVWNETAMDWREFEVSRNFFNMSRAVYIYLETELSYPAWGELGVAWSDLTVESEGNLNALYDTQAGEYGLFNVSIAVNDTLGKTTVVTTNFTMVAFNYPPGKPFILTPAPGETVSGETDIVWSDVTDANGDSIQFNISLLNSDGSFNSTIIDGFGDESTNSYTWNTSQVPDGYYKLRVEAYENDTVERKSNSYDLTDDITVYNSVPSIQFDPPTDISGSTLYRFYILANATTNMTSGIASITITLLNSTGGIVNTTTSSTAPLFANFTGPGDGIFTGLEDGTYFLQAEVTDILSQTASTEIRNITIVNQYLARPSIVSAWTNGSAAIASSQWESILELNFTSPLVVSSAHYLLATITTNASRGSAVGEWRVLQNGNLTASASRSLSQGQEGSLSILTPNFLASKSGAINVTLQHRRVSGTGIVISSDMTVGITGLTDLSNNHTLQQAAYTLDEYAASTSPQLLRTLTLNATYAGYLILDTDVNMYKNVSGDTSYYFDIIAQNANHSCGAVTRTSGNNSFGSTYYTCSVHVDAGMVEARLWAWSSAGTTNLSGNLHMYLYGNTFDDVAASANVTYATLTSPAVIGFQNLSIFLPDTRDILAQAGIVARNTGTASTAFFRMNLYNSSGALIAQGNNEARYFGSGYGVKAYQYDFVNISSGWYKVELAAGTNAGTLEITNGTFQAFASYAEQATVTELPPTAPIVFAPLTGNYTSGILYANWTASLSPHGGAINAYNVSLFFANGTFVQTVNSTIELTQAIDLSGLAAGDYTVGVRASDDGGHLSPWGYSENFTVLGAAVFQTYYGNVTGVVNLGRSGGVLHSFGNYSSALVYAADADSVIDWGSLQSIGLKKDNTSATSDFADIDAALNLSIIPTNVNATWSVDGSTARLPTNMSGIFGKELLHVPLANSTNASTFQTGILWDTSDAVSQEYTYADQQDLVFFTRVNLSQIGTYGTYDYELKVPANLQAYKGATESIALYVELQ